MTATQWQTCVGISTRVEHSSDDGHSSIHDAAQMRAEPANMLTRHVDDLPARNVRSQPFLDMNY
ncbi:MAG TPA: hypothetical protein VER98_05985 [Terriglobia bacterium]|nr:hypothetical protein [Terriglobia bacterium]